MHRVSDSALSSPPFAEPGQLEVEAALAAMSPAERLRLFWRTQEVAIARSWALVDRSGLHGERAGVELVIRSRYPEWSDSEVERLLSAICQREDPAAWLERLRQRANEIKLELARLEPRQGDSERYCLSQGMEAGWSEAHQDPSV
jgi:hypothetical protein